MSQDTPAVTVNSFPQRGKTPSFGFVLPSSGHILTTNKTMFTIRPLLKGLEDNKHSKRGLATFYTAVFSSFDDPHFFLNLCGATKGECRPGVAPILLCKIGLVLNGVHQFLPCKGSTGSLVLLLLPLMHLLRSLSAAVDL